MAQGDSISGIWSVNFSSTSGNFIFDIAPPSGQVWLITWLNRDALGSGIILVDNVRGYSLDITALLSKENIKIFITNTCFIRLTVGPYGSFGSRWIMWSGVQFK